MTMTAGRAICELVKATGGPRSKIFMVSWQPTYLYARYLCSRDALGDRVSCIQPTYYLDIRYYVVYHYLRAKRASTKVVHIVYQRISTYYLTIAHHHHGRHLDPRHLDPRHLDHRHLEPRHLDPGYRTVETGMMINHSTLDCHVTSSTRSLAGPERLFKTL